MALSLVCRLSLAYMLFVWVDKYGSASMTDDNAMDNSTRPVYPTGDATWQDWTTGWYWPTSPPPSQDLTGRMFSMTYGSYMAFQGFPYYQSTYAFTVCLRIISEFAQSSNIYVLTMGNTPALSLMLSSYAGDYQLTLGQASKGFKMASQVPSISKLWPWTSLCVTWTSDSGMTQMWKDGQMSVRKGMWRGQGFSGTPVLSLSGFEGQVMDVHMWNEAVPLSTLRSYNRGWGYPPGNMLSWSRTGYSSRGYVVLEKAYDSVAAAAEEDGAGKQKKGRRHWRKHGMLGNVVQEGPDSNDGCLGLRKRCGKRRTL
ncbi:hypothetical protein ACEWY4_025030 [Coilia grayii]|uniref:Pentraxin (PTX) domain-containing protein n=1 Tax=Coilia grayii TaxID=363190 RepID=A0ABD1IWD5_9TELE